MDLYMGFHKWWYPFIAGWFHGKSRPLKWMMKIGVPGTRKPPYADDFGNTIYE